MADEDAWRRIGRDNRAEYDAGAPWPHLVLDHLLPEDLIAMAEEEELPRAISLPTSRSHQEVKSESSTAAGPAATALLDAVSAPAFIAFLSELTGIPALVPDPTHVLSGLHVSGPGSFQAVHRDFFRHPVTNLWHRVNVLVYLNSSWPEEYGGQLELWPLDMSACARRVSPVAGTVAIFETRYETLHGVPEPTTCPPGRARMSLASHYYTKDRPVGARLHDPIFRHPRRPQDPLRMGIARPGHIALGLIHPLYVHVPIVKRALNRVRPGL